MLKQKTKYLENEIIDSTVVFPRKDVYQLAEKFYKWNSQKKEQLISRLQLYFTKGLNKDFLVIHSPGGWGNTEWEGLLEWKKA